MANKKQLIIGQPVEPMLVRETGNGEKRYDEIIKTHNGTSYVQIKSDGYRIQVHNNGQLRFFTRNLNELNTEAYPDVVGQLKKIPKGIFDGEIVGIEDGINGFRAIKARKREGLDLELVKQYPLQIKFFDVLNLNGTDLYDNPLLQRRKTLENYFNNVSEQWIIDNKYDLKEKFLEITDERGLEGLVCKDPQSSYLFGKKGKEWLKLKKFLTLDLVVLGIYEGEGKAAKLPFAALLLGIKNNNHYETITKVGIAKKNIINDIYEKIKPFYTPEVPDNVVINPSINKNAYSGKKPFRYIPPEKSAVVEVETMNITRSKNWHSCGLDNNFAYSLRIPIVQKYREDKTYKDINTTKQISELYVE